MCLCGAPSVLFFGWGAREAPRKIHIFRKSRRRTTRQLNTQFDTIRCVMYASLYLFHSQSCVYCCQIVDSLIQDICIRASIPRRATTVIRDPTQIVHSSPLQSVNNCWVGRIFECICVHRHIRCGVYREGLIRVCMCVYCLCRRQRQPHSACVYVAVLLITQVV